MYLTRGFFRLRLNTSRLKPFVVVLLAVAVFFQLYPTFDSYFIADDFGWLGFAKRQQSALTAALQPSLGDWTTPIPNVIFWGLFQIFGFNPVGYYLVFAGIHVLNSWLVYRLVYNVVRHEATAITAAALFALHFAHFSDWGPLVWISAFVQIVVATFYLLALVLFVRYLRFKRPRYYVGIVICFVLALAAKETALTLPILLVAWYAIDRRSFDRGEVREAAVLFAPFAATVGAYLLYKLLVQQTSDRYMREGLYSIGTHLFTNWKYFSNLVMPNPESPPVRSFLLRGLPSWVFLLTTLATGLVRAGLVVAGVVTWWRGTQNHRWWIAFAIIAYLPFLGFAGGYAGANRYFYLPAVGFAALLAGGLVWIYRRLANRSGATVATFSLTMLVLVLWGYNIVPIRTWQQHMHSMSSVEQQVIAAVDRYVSERDEPVSGVYLVDFPAEDAAQLKRIVQLVFGLKPKEANGAVEAPTNSLLLLYERDRISVRRP